MALTCVSAECRQACRTLTHRQGRVDAGFAPTLPDVRRRCWTTHLRQRRVTPFDLWVENPMRPAARRIGDWPRQQHVFNGLAQAEVGGERECSEQLGERRALIWLVSLHARDATTARWQGGASPAVSDRCFGYARAEPRTRAWVKTPGRVRGVAQTSQSRPVVVPAGLFVLCVADLPRGCRPR